MKNRKKLMKVQDPTNCKKKKGEPSALGSRVEGSREAQLYSARQPYPCLAKNKL